jgi:hypothetical protein
MSTVILQKDSWSKATKKKHFFPKKKKTARCEENLA